MLILLIIQAHGVDFGYCSRGTDGSTMYFSTNVCIYEPGNQHYLSVTEVGVGFYFSDSNCTIMDSLVSFPYKLYKCYHNDLTVTNSFSLYYDIESSVEKRRRIEYIYMNVCYKSHTDSYLISVQDGYFSIAFFQNTTQCKDEVSFIALPSVTQRWLQ